MRGIHRTGDQNGHHEFAIAVLQGGVHEAADVAAADGVGHRLGEYRGHVHIDRLVY